MLPRVAAVVLNWCNWRDSIECLDSLFDVDYPNLDVIVVDNHSTDDSLVRIVDHLKRKVCYESSHDVASSLADSPMQVFELASERSFLPPPELERYEQLPPKRRCLVVRNSTNYGYAEGNNIGMRFAIATFNPAFILLLNNDTVVDKRFLVQMVRVGDADGRVAMIGPRVDYYHNPDRIAAAYQRQISLWTGDYRVLQHWTAEDVPQGNLQVGWLSGCCVLVRTSAITKVGYLDSSFFLYGEDTDWSYRMVKAGYLLKYVPSARISHKVSASGEPSTAFYYFSRNLFLLEKKHASRLQIAAFLLFFFSYRFWVLTGGILLIKRSWRTYRHFVNGVIDGLMTGGSISSNLR